MKNNQLNKNLLICGDNFFAFSFTRGAHEEVARVKGKSLDIKLVRVEDLLYGKVKV